MPGIGPWVAQYVALLALGEPDAFPPGDPVLRVLVADKGRSANGDIEDRAQAWRPWRGYAVIHLWEAARPTKNTRSRDRGARVPQVVDRVSARAHARESV